MTEPILTIRVKCFDAQVVKGHTMDIVMIPFEGSAQGPVFSGTVTGRGVDTQKIPKGGSARLSARYMLEGTDFAGAKCKVFIENNSTEEGLVPLFITDSPALAKYETMPLASRVTPIEGGVLVKIFAEQPQNGLHH